MYLHQTVKQAAEDKKADFLGQEIADFVAFRNLFDRFVVADKYDVPHRMELAGFLISQMTESIIKRCDDGDADMHRQRDNLVWLVENTFECKEVPAKLATLIVLSFARHQKRVSEYMFNQDQMHPHPRFARLLFARKCEDLIDFTEAETARLNQIDLMAAGMKAELCCLKQKRRQTQLLALGYLMLVNTRSCYVDHHEGNAWH